MQLFENPAARNSLALLLLSLLLTGCGAQLRNLPVGAGNVQLSASAGGPLVKAFDTTVPIPYALAGVTYGLSDRWEVYLDAHVTAAAFKFFGATPGVVWFPELPVGKWVPALGADLLIFSDFQDTQLYPELTTSVAHPLGSKWVPYGGVRHTFQTTQQPVYIPSAFAGTSYRLGQAQLFVEAQWLAANQDSRWNPVDYTSPGHRGAIATQLGMTLDLGGRR